MKSVSRALAILFMGPFLLTLSFAEDAASSTDNSTKTAVPFKAPALTHPLAFAEPSALPKTNAGASTSNGSNTPLAELFLGYSFIRFNTKTIVAGSQNFDANGGDANLAFNLNRCFA